VRVRRWQLFPLLIEPLKTYSGAPTSENDAILRHWQRIHAATEGRGTWVLDRGFDRRELLLPRLAAEMAFVVRPRGDRHIWTMDARLISVEQRAVEVYPQQRPKRWPRGGWTYTETVFLPEGPEHELRLVLFWRLPDCCPWMLLVSRQARRPGRSGAWFVRADRRRWGLEDATWGIQQRSHLEQFLVRSWRSIRRLICLVALAFFWLNLWLLAESLGRRPLSNPPARLPPPPWALAQGGNLSVRLAGHANQPISPPKTQNRPTRLLRHRVNSRPALDLRLAQVVAYSQATITGDPTSMPSISAAFSPTTANSSRPLEPIRATKVPRGRSA
jgi:hypothetical protein